MKILSKTYVFLTNHISDDILNKWRQKFCVYTYILQWYNKFAVGDIMHEIGIADILEKREVEIDGENRTYWEFIDVCCGLAINYNRVGRYFMCISKNKFVFLQCIMQRSE